MRFQPVIVIDPLLALVLVFWKPLLIGFLLFVVLLTFVFLPVTADMAREDAKQAVLPTMQIPDTWRASLTQGALRNAQTPTPR